MPSFLSHAGHTLTNFNKGSKAYSAGLLPEASCTVRMIFLPSSNRVNLEAVAAGIPLALEKRLLLNIGFEKINVSHFPNMPSK